MDIPVAIVPAAEDSSNRCWISFALFDSALPRNTRVVCSAWSLILSKKGNILDSAVEMSLESPAFEHPFGSEQSLS